MKGLLLRIWELLWGARNWWGETDGLGVLFGIGQLRERGLDRREAGLELIDLALLDDRLGITPARAWILNSADLVWVVVCAGALPVLKHNAANTLALAAAREEHMLNLLSGS